MKSHDVFIFISFLVRFFGVDGIVGSVARYGHVGRAHHNKKCSP